MSEATANPVIWTDFLAEEKEKPYFKQVMAFVHAEREAGKVIYPEQKNVFNAVKYTPLDQVKVVMLGQDPYHGPNQAHGLCFSVQEGVRIPPSLQNMYKELHRDIGFNIPNHGCLIPWAKQGVLMLNTVLTVEAGNAHSHANQGWEIFTDKVISVVNEALSGVVFLLWGSHAQKKAAMIDPKKHHILKTTHPSPLSAHRGFLGCGHFSQANALLKGQGKSEIDWAL